MKKWIHKIQTCFLVLIMLFTVSDTAVDIHADGLEVRQAIQEIIGPYIGGSSYHYSYQGGNYFDTILTSNNAEELYNIGLDCTSGTLAIVSKAIRNMGGDPYRYFGECRNYLNSVYPYELATHFTNMSKVADGIVNDTSILLPGDIIVYGKLGEKGHMNVYCGNNQTFDFGSNGNGAVGNYRGFGNYFTYKTASTSTTGSYPISAIYRITLNKTISYSIVKKSGSPTVSSNAMYSLAGATFGVYTDASCNAQSQIDTLVTDSNGYASGTKTVSNNIQTLYVKEISAPTNFLISDSSVHTIMLNNNSGSTEFLDEPLYGNQLLEIYKVDKEGKKYSASMSEAQFTYTYYDTLDDITNAQPVASWVLKTMPQYSDEGVSYVALMDDAHLVSGTFIKNSQGTPVLPLGTITIQETKSATNYTVEGAYFDASGNECLSTEDILTLRITNDNHTIKILAGNQATDSTIQKEETPIRASYQIQKKDIDVLNDATQNQYHGVRSQGDATFAYAEFDLYYIGNDTDAQASMMIDHDGDGLGDGQEYLPSETEPIDHITLDASGYYETPNATYLASGNYKLQETKAPEGYSILDPNTKQPLSMYFTLKNDREKLYLDAIEKVYAGDIQITKTWNTSQTSSFTKPEQGAVFDIVLKKYVLDEAAGREVTRQIVMDAYLKASSWEGKDESQHSVIGYTDMEYDRITTDVNGIAKSKKLAYGEYYLVQSSAQNESKLIEDVKEFSIEKENQETLYFQATNNTKGYILKLFKKDADSGELVTFTSSAFKIHMLKDIDGNDVSNKTSVDTSMQNRLVNGYVVQTIGESTKQTIYDVFMTASKMQSKENPSLEEGVFYGINNTLDNNESASSCLPIELLPGEYQLEEVITSDGYITSGPLKFKIEEQSITYINEMKQNVIELVFENKQLTGNVAFHKEILHWQQADISLIEENFTKFGFTLYAAEDIKRADTGEIIMKKDEQAKFLTNDKTQPYQTYPEVHPDEKGNFKFDNLPLGKYYLKETTTLQGLVTNDKKIEIEIKQTMFDHAIDMKTSLPFGFGEVQDRSVKKDDIEVTIDGNVTTKGNIQNDVTKTTISKVDITNEEELPGASMRLIGENVDILWISTDKPYQIEGLKPGTYTLYEEASPKGYYYHSEIEFCVKDDGSVQKVKMEDTPIHYQLHKVDDYGNPVIGVKLRLFDITDHTQKKEIPLENDGITSEKPFDLYGQLEVLHTYELVEEEYVEGVFKAEKVVFQVEKVSSERCIHITMTDLLTSISVSKVDEDGNFVEGAQLEIVKAFENESGEILASDQEDASVYTFTSTNVPEDISAYVKGSSEHEKVWYILRETHTPFGYKTMEEIPFYVTGDLNQMQTIQAVNVKETMKIRGVKVDASNHAKVLEGAEITLFDQDGNIVKDIDGNSCVQTSDVNGFVTFFVKYEEGYYLQETKAPTNYILEKRKYEIVVDETFTFDTTYECVIENKPEKTVDTSDTSNILLYCGICSVALIGSYKLLKFRLTRS